MTDDSQLLAGSQRGHLRLIFVCYASDMLKQVWLDPKRVVLVEPHRTNRSKCIVTVQNLELEPMTVFGSVKETMTALGLVPPLTVDEILRAERGGA
jgi:hypothetical protein